jgi:hypothetical protein
MNKSAFIDKKARMLKNSMPHLGLSVTLAKTR